MIKAHDLGKTVATSEGQLTILKGIDLEIKKSESVAIVGASGSGKTTLLSLLAGLDTPSRGQIFLGDHEITSLDEEERALVRSELVGFVFQSFQLLASLTAVENVMLPAELKGDSDALQKSMALLERVGLQHRVNHYPKQLSGGEQQRVAIARAFASSVDILFADEPTGNLDTATGQHIIDLIFDLNEEFGTTLVLVTHDQRLADRCGRSIQIASGEIVMPELEAVAQAGER
jgi:putative ABC transport system ATP-binding protein